MERLASVLCVSLPLAAGVFWAPAARADCTSELRSVRAETAAVKDERRRAELQRLVEKAEKDEKSGRVTACDKTLEQARLLLK